MLERYHDQVYARRMLQFSGLGDAYSDCLARNPGDTEFCAVYTASPDPRNAPAPDPTDWFESLPNCPVTHQWDFKLGACVPAGKLISPSFFSTTTGKMLLALAGLGLVGGLIYKYR